MSNRLIFSTCFINRFLNLPIKEIGIHMEALRAKKGEEYAECFLEKLHEVLYFRNLKETQKWN